MYKRIVSREEISEGYLILGYRYLVATRVQHDLTKITRSCPDDRYLLPLMNIIMDGWREEVGG